MLFRKGTRTIKFEKIKIPHETDPLKYYTIDEGSLQEIILKYCLEHNLEIVTIQIDNLKCKVKLKNCTKEQVYKFVIKLLEDYNECLKNFKY